ncbi:hypothetical protein PENSUB_13092 [Penicillium subrubescens]|uniref:Uncharacterized protein n=1 Tax=Penicillium subrubescens TaxID=1316194 RepID=A0A1Q5SU35_9EURO|nr:hypothetical protein PENSUB_13092 [Penicillium subrubescens]
MFKFCPYWCNHSIGNLQRAEDVANERGGNGMTQGPEGRQSFRAFMESLYPSAKLTDEGIDSSYVEFGDYTWTQYYPSTREMRELDYNFNNFPIKSGSMVVPNPNDIVSQAVPNMPALRSHM